MLGFVQNFFAPKSHPIGVDFGTECLRLAQVQNVGDDYRLTAAASADVPLGIRNDPVARLNFFTKTVDELLHQAPFRGRQAVLSLAAGVTTIHRLHLPHMDDAGLKQALPNAMRGKMEVDPSEALLRHIVAGNVRTDEGSQAEVIVFAATRQWVQDYLAAAARTKLEVVAMNLEPQAVVDCFSHVYRRGVDKTATHAYIDIGGSGTRFTVSRGGKILFTQNIGIGGEQFTQAVADGLHMHRDDARMLRIKLAAEQTAALTASRSSDHSSYHEAPPEITGRAVEQLVTVGGGDETDSNGLQRETPPGRRAVADVSEIWGQREPKTSRLTTLFEPSLDSPSNRRAAQYDQVNFACQHVREELIEQLQTARNEHEKTFPSAPIDRLIFIGGEAVQRTLCQDIARVLETRAQLGDPMCRIAKTSVVNIESGIDRRTPQPAWAVALGLSMGAANSPK